MVCLLDNEVLTKKRCVASVHNNRLIRPKTKRDYPVQKLRDRPLLLCLIYKIQLSIVPILIANPSLSEQLFD